MTEHFDLPILEWIRENLRCTVLDTLMPDISALADSGAIWIAIALVLLFIPKHRRLGIQMALALSLGFLVCNLILKPLVGRIRPYQYVTTPIPLLVAPLRDYSFPSGHTIASFESATVLLLRSRKWGIAAMVFASLIAFSRLYLYVHYPTDVMTSVVLGIGIGYLAKYLVNRRRPLAQP